MCGLIGDIAECIGPNIKDLLKQQFVEQVYLAVTSEADAESKQVGDWAFFHIKASLGLN